MARCAHARMADPRGAELPGVPACEGGPRAHGGPDEQRQPRRGRGAGEGCAEPDGGGHGGGEAGEEEGAGDEGFKQKGRGGRRLFLRFTGELGERLGKPLKAIMHALLHS